MLTKTDLDQIGKIVKKIVRQEVEAEVKGSSHHLEAEIRLTRMELVRKLEKAEDKLKDLQIQGNNNEKSLEELKRRTRKIEKDVDALMKLPRAHARGIFSPCFVGSKIPPKQKLLRIHPRAYAPGFLRRGINHFDLRLIRLEKVAKN